MIGNLKPCCSTKKRSILGKSTDPWAARCGVGARCVERGWHVILTTREGESAAWGQHGGAVAVALAAGERSDVALGRRGDERGAAWRQRSVRCF